MAHRIEPIDLTVVVETPENVALRMPLATPIIRARAYFIDLLIRSGIVAIGSIAIFVVGIGFRSIFVSIGLILVLMFLVEWFYYVFFEGFFRGVTPGKKMYGLRVVQEGGYPIGLWQALLRNLARAGDTLPFGYAFGLMTMIVSGRGQRLGDLAARTLVIDETPRALPREPVILERILPLPKSEIGSWIPGNSTLTLIEQFLARRKVLTYERGHELAGQFAKALAQRLNYHGDPLLVTDYPMAFLARVYATFQQQLGADDLANVVAGRSFVPPQEFEVELEALPDEPAAAGAQSLSTKPVDAGIEKSAALAGRNMTKRDFIQRRMVSWTRFRELLQRFEEVRLFRRQTGFDPGEFSRRFRETCYDLSLVRSRDWGTGLDAYLNHLVTRGHNVFYRPPPAQWRALWNFLAVGFPQLFRANIGYFLVSCALFFGTFFASWGVVQFRPSLAVRIVPQAALDQMDKMYGPKQGASGPRAGDAGDQGNAGLEENADQQKNERFGNEDERDPADITDDFFGLRAAMAGFYIRNNIGIALQAFGRGIATAAGTVYTLVSNGVVIGAMFGHTIAAGNGSRLLGFVIAHGSFELTAIAVAGGAGLMLGDGMLRTGRRRWLDSVLSRAMDAVQIAFGAAAMLLVAAFIEAFWSPLPIAFELKLAVGAVLWVLVFLYLFGAGRGAAATVTQSSRR